MTRRGIGFFLFFVLLLLLALATGTSEIFLAVFMTGFVFAFAFASAAAGVFALHIRYELEDKTIFRGEKAPVKLYIKGFAPLPVILSVTLVLPGDKKYKCVSGFFGYKQKIVSYAPVFPHRGLWQIGLKTVFCCDIFGFFTLPVRKKHLNSGVTSITVFPMIFETPGLPPRPLPAMEYSESSSVSAEHGDSFSDTRRYRDGDPLKRIHWKLSMRTRELHTRLYDMAVDRIVAIVIDTSLLIWEPAESTLNYADMATECAASLANFYTGGGHTIRLCQSGGAEDTTVDFMAIHNRLASMAFGINASLEDTVSQLLKDASLFSAVFVIARFPTAGLIDILSNTAPGHGNVSIIYPDATGYAAPKQILPNGIQLIAIANPRNITERLGDLYD